MSKDQNTDMLENDINQLIFEELPNSLANSVNVENEKNKEIEKNNIEYIYNSIESKIRDILYEHGYTSNGEVESKVAEALNENKSEVLNIVRNSRDNSSEEISFSIKNISRIEAEKLKDNIKLNKDEEHGLLEQTKNEIYSNAESIIDNPDNSKVEGTLYEIEDSILTEMKSQMSRDLRIHESEQGESAFYDIDKIITYELKSKLEEEYLGQTMDMKKNILESIEGELQEFGNQYENLNERLNQQEKNSVEPEIEITDSLNNDFADELSKYTNTPEDIDKATAKRLENEERNGLLEKPDLSQKLPDDLLS